MDLIEQESSGMTGRKKMGKSTEKYFKSGHREGKHQNGQQNQYCIFVNKTTHLHTQMSIQTFI